MGSELLGVPVSAAKSAPPASPKAVLSSTLSGIRAPLTIDDPDSEYYLSGDDDNKDSALSGYETDTGSETADPDDKILEKTPFVKEYVVSKPVMKIPGFGIDKRSSLDRNLEVVDGVVRTSVDKDESAGLVQSPRVSSGISSIIRPAVDNKAVLKLPAFETNKRGSFDRNIDVFGGVVRTSVVEDENGSLGRLPRVSSGSGTSSIIGPVGGRHVVSKPVVRIPSFEIGRSSSFDRNLGSMVRSPRVSSGIASIITPIEEKVVFSKPVLKIPGLEIEKRESFDKNLEVVGTSAGGNGNGSLVRSPRVSVSSGISSIISPEPVGEKYVVSKPVLRTSGFVIEKSSSFGRNLGAVNGVVRTSVDEVESGSLLQLPRVNSESSSMIRPAAKVSTGSDDDDDDFKSNSRAVDEPFVGVARVPSIGSAPKVRNLDDYASDGESVEDTTLVGDDKGPFVDGEARNVVSYVEIQESDLIPEENVIEDGDDGKTCDATGFTDEESIGSNVVMEFQQVLCGDVLDVEVADSSEEVCGNANEDGNEPVSEGLESEIEQKTDQEPETNGFLEVEVAESKAEANMEAASTDCGYCGDEITGGSETIFEPRELEASEGLQSEIGLKTDQNQETDDVLEVEVIEQKFDKTLETYDCLDVEVAEAKGNMEESSMECEKRGDENINENGTDFQTCQFGASKDLKCDIERRTDQTLDTHADTVYLEATDSMREAKILHQILLASGKPYAESFNFDFAKKMALIAEAEGKNDSEFSLNVLVIGKSGVGKSATINSLFGEEKARIDAFQPGTTSVKPISGNLNGIRIQVLDTPGFNSTIADHKTLSSIKKLIRKTPPDVVLYVDRLDTQVGDLTDLPLFKLITHFLGSSIWSRTILTLTHAASADPMSYDDSFVAKKLHAVQELVRHSIGDFRVIPVSLIENNLRMEENEHKSQLLILCFAMKLLSDMDPVVETNMERNVAYLHEYDHWEGQILLRTSLKNANSQLSVRLDSRLSIQARLDGKRRRNGMVCIRCGSSDERLISALAFLPIAKALCRAIFMFLSK